MDAKQEFKKLIDDICHDTVVKYTKKEETEKSFELLKQEFINQITKNVINGENKKSFRQQYTFIEKEDKTIKDISNPIFENINLDYLKVLCNNIGINVKETSFFNKEKTVLIEFIYLYNYIEEENMPKIKKKSYI